MVISGRDAGSDVAEPHNDEDGYVDEKVGQSLTDVAPTCFATSSTNYNFDGS